MLIVDDDAYVRNSLRTILGSQGIDVVGEADDGDQVPEKIARHRPDVVLIDLQMARVGGEEVIRRNADRPGAPRFVALTNFGSEDAVMRVLRAGAAGFLSKDDDPMTLAAHLNAVGEGGAALSSGAASAVIRRSAPTRHTRVTTARTQLAQLTDREREVATLVAGHTNDQIGRRLNMSPNTVKAHVKNATTKLDLVSRAELAVVVALASIDA